MIKHLNLIVLLILSMSFSSIWGYAQEENIYKGINKVDTTKYKHRINSDCICDLLPVIDGKVLYSEIVQVDNKNADDLYASLKSWAAKTFVNADRVIKLDDPVSHKMIIKASCPVSKAGQFFYFTLTVETRDGRYKYDVSDFLMQGIKVFGVFRETFEERYESANCNKKATQKELTVVNRNVLGMIQGLNDGMKEDNVSKNDW